MNNGIIKDEIKWLLEAINEQSEAIHRHDGKIPHIEFDILMDNVRKFYEKIHILQRLNEPVLHHEPAPSVTSPVAEVPVRYRETEPVAAKPDVPGEHNRLPIQPPPVQFKPAGSAAVRQEPSHAPKKPAKSQDIDLFAADEQAYSIKLTAAREKTLGPKIPSERIENLKTAISINEKFMFINELFDGNLREYNETIETLNGFKTLDQAADYLDLMRKRNFWNTGSPAFKKLSELVERRF